MIIISARVHQRRCIYLLYFLQLLLAYFLLSSIKVGFVFCKYTILNPVRFSTSFVCKIIYNFYLVRRLIVLYLVNFRDVYASVEFLCIHQLLFGTGMLPSLYICMHIPGRVL